MPKTYGEGVFTFRHDLTREQAEAIRLRLLEQYYLPEPIDIWWIGSRKWITINSGEVDYFQVNDWFDTEKICKQARVDELGYYVRKKK